MTNVFKIRHGKETHVYRTDIAADKKNLLSQFRHVAEELAAKKRKEREGEHQRRKSMWMGDVSAPPRSYSTRSTDSCDNLVRYHSAAPWHLATTSQACHQSQNG